MGDVLFFDTRFFPFMVEGNSSHLLYQTLFGGPDKYSMVSDLSVKYLSGYIGWWHLYVVRTEVSQDFEGMGWWNS